MSEQGEHMVDDGTSAEANARLMGWVPLEEFRGGEASWIDAETFVERGQQIMPLLQKNNERLLGQVTGLNQQVTALDSSLRAANAAIEALQASHDEDVQSQVEAARADLRAEIERASQEGDHAGLADATDKLTQLNVAEKKAAPAAVDDAAQRPAIHPEVASWNAEHAEFYNSPRRVALGNAIAREMRAAGDVRIGTAFMDAMAAEVAKALGEGDKGYSKVLSGNGGTGRGEAQLGTAKTYADLPAEAKAACDKMASRLVGPNRAHKDEASWRKAYVKNYDWSN